MKMLPAWMLLIALYTISTRDATQVGSAPYKVSSTGAGNSYAPVFSADGRHVAFVSHANNLVTNDDLGPHLDLFVRNLVASNTVLVSVSTNAIGGANDSIGLYTLSSNAQVIAFETLANNLAPGDSNRHRDIYVRDLASGVTRLITPGANGPSSNPFISEDGQRVIFESLASNLVTNDFNGTNDIFIHDLTTGITELVTLNSSNTASPDGPSHSPSISADGLTVTFVSHATNLVEGVTNKLGEVYARNVTGRSNLWAAASHLSATRLSTLPNGVPTGVPGPYIASEPVLSADGRLVAFKTVGQTVRFDLRRSTNRIIEFFPPSPVQGALSNYFLFYDNPRLATSASEAPLWFSRDGRFAAYTTRTNFVRKPAVLLVDFDSFVTNVIPDSAQGSVDNWWVTNQVVWARTVLTNADIPVPNLEKTWTQMPWLTASADASRLTVLADAANFVAGVTNRAIQMYSIDVDSSAIQLISTNSRGEPGLGLNGIVPASSPDGSLIAWDSPDDNIVADDLNRAWDVFVRNVDTGESTLVSARHPNLSAASAIASSRIAGSQSLSGDGSKIVVLTQDSDLTANDTNHLADATLRDLRTGTNAMVSGPFVAPIFYGSTILATVRPTNHLFFSAIGSSGNQVVYVGQALDPFFGTRLGHTNLNWRDLESNASEHGIGSIAGSTTMSSDGRLVAFYRYVSLGFNEKPGLNLLDCRNRPATNKLISSSRSLPTKNANDPSINPVFSPDSRWIVFQSLATDLTYDPDLISGYQLYAREIDTAFIKRISYDSVSQTNVYPLAGGATNPVFSADARFVFFDGATNRTIYRHDLLNDMNDAGTERRLNLEVCTGCANPSPSAEGRFVAYETRPASGGITNIFLKDIESGAVELISVSLTGTNGNGSSFSPLLSHDARFVVFASRASDLVPGDNNRVTDIFVRDRWAGATHCLSRNLAGTGTGNRVSSNPILSADGRTVAFQSFAGDLVAGDYNDTRDVFVVTLGGPDNDGDGMEDDWELAHFNTLARDGSGDFDNDGASDLAEFRAGTNPSNNASILRVLRLTTGVSAGTPAPRTTVILWNAVPGKTYRVETKSDLNAAWTAIGTDVTAGSTTASATHVLDGNANLDTRHSFYRVTLVQ